MSLIDAIILGIVQGITEFLPISSSGHLALAQRMFGYAPSLSFTIAAHVGTLVSILVVFRREVAELLSGLARSASALARGRFKAAYLNDQGVRLFVMVVWAMLPTVAAALLIKKYLADWMSQALFVGLALIVNGGVLFATRYLKAEKQAGRVPGLSDSLTIGLAQGLAVTYGLSRSGLTIATGLFRRLGGEFAVRFSFLIAIPAIVGAQMLEATTGTGTSKVRLECSALAAGVSAVVGYVFLRFLVGAVRRGKLSVFAYYCWLAGALALVYHFVG